jgi:hypothetical protein
VEICIPEEQRLRFFSSGDKPGMGTVKTTVAMKHTNVTLHADFHFFGKNMFTLKVKSTIILMS